MLHGLFGNKSVEKILLFLLVNEKGYATQVHRVLNAPLTPLQKALERLEREGILISFFEGKTRFYIFNAHYPLLNELEALLKKAYALLSPREKSHYYFIRHFPKERKMNQNFLLTLWETLKGVSHVTFQFRSRGGGKGFGTGRVEVQKAQDAQLIFQEKGTWQGLNDQEFVFRNVFRWSFNRIDGLITLEHLRFGVNNPVFLFHLIPAGPDYLESAHAHLCGQDTYFGQLEFKAGVIKLIWRILGPKRMRRWPTFIKQPLEKTPHLNYHLCKRRVRAEHLDLQRLAIDSQS